MRDQVFVFYADGGVLWELQRRDWLEDLGASTATHCVNGCGPNFMLSSLDRELMHRVLASKRMIYTLITDNPLGRGMATSASWAGIDARVHPWDNLRQAATDMCLPSALEAEVCQVLRQLRLEVTSRIALIHRNTDRQSEGKGPAGDRRPISDRPPVVEYSDTPPTATESEVSDHTPLSGPAPKPGVHIPRRQRSGQSG